MATKPKGRDELISGLSMCLVFGALGLIFNRWFWIFPFVFAGVLPAARGAMHLFSTRKAEQQQLIASKQAGSEAIERAILRAAEAQQGRITPALIALNSEISIQDADLALQEMVKQGYATMDIRDNGTIEYVFQEFIRRLE